MKTAVAIRHLVFEDLGLIEPWLQQRGWRTVTYDAGVDELRPADILEADLLVVLGGPMGAHDDALYPCLADEVALIRQRIAHGRPLLGICLGAQLMARALGAAVTPMGFKEIGFGPLTLTPQGAESPLAQIGGQPVLHWHGDQFELPNGCAALASTPRCRQQAFMVGDHALGLQFHLEVDAAQIEQWIMGHGHELKQAGIDTASLRRMAAEHRIGLAGALDAVLTDWFTRLQL